MQSTTMTVTAHDGTSLFTHRWLPDGDTRAAVVVVHGIADHSARFAGLAEALTAAGYAVYAHDQRGHGRTASDAERAIFAEEGGWESVVDDVRAVCEAAHAEQGDRPVFLLGHSMGSTIVRDYVIRGSEGLSGLVISGPVYDPGLKRLGGLFLAKVMTRLHGHRHASELLDKVAYASYNSKWDVKRTKFDWLSRGRGRGGGPAPGLPRGRGVEFPQ